MHDFFTAGMHWQILNFAVFIGILYFVLKKPVGEFWTVRARNIGSRLEESAKLAREAHKKHEAIGRRASGIEQEAGALIHSLEKEGIEEKKKMIEEAEKTAQRIAGDRERIIAQEIQKARQGLKSQVIQLSTEMAEKLILENLREDDQTRLSEHTLSQVEGSRV